MRKPRLAGVSERTGDALRNDADNGSDPARSSGCTVASPRSRSCNWLAPLLGDDGGRNAWWDCCWCCNGSGGADTRTRNAARCSSCSRCSPRRCAPRC